MRGRQVRFSASRVEISLLSLEKLGGKRERERGKCLPFRPSLGRINKRDGGEREADGVASERNQLL